MSLFEAKLRRFEKQFKLLYGNSRFYFTSHYFEDKYQYLIETMNGLKTDMFNMQHQYLRLFRTSK